MLLLQIDYYCVVLRSSQPRTLPTIDSVTLGEEQWTFSQLMKSTEDGPKKNNGHLVSWCRAQKMDQERTMDTWSFDREHRKWTWTRRTWSVNFSDLPVWGEHTKTRNKNSSYMNYSDLPVWDEQFIVRCVLNKVLMSVFINWMRQLPNVTRVLLNKHVTHTQWEYHSSCSMLQTRTL